MPLKKMNKKNKPPRQAGRCHCKGNVLQHQEPAAERVKTDRHNALAG